METSLDGIRLVDVEDDPVGSSRAAVAPVSAGEASALMKGSQHTDELLSALLKRDANLRTSRRISHVFRFDLPAYHKPLMVTDAVVNLVPTLQNKVDILANAIGLAHAIRLSLPKIALLSAIETVNPELPSSLDAATLAKMADRGQLKGAIVGGPLAFDNGISAASASKFAGQFASQSRSRISPAERRRHLALRAVGASRDLGPPLGVAPRRTGRSISRRIPFVQTSGQGVHRDL